MNKKITYVLLGLTIILGSSACSNNINYEQQIEEANAEIKSLNEQLDQVIKEKDQVSNELERLKEEINKEKQEITITEGDVTISFVDKVNTPKNTEAWVFSSYSTFHISITNNTDKEIKGIQGVVDIQDMFGVSIMKSQCDLTGFTIKSGETIVNTDLSLEINEFMDTHTKVYNTDFEDLKFVYDVQTIMFTDGTSKSK